MDGFITIGTKVDGKGLAAGLASMEKQIDKSMSKVTNTIKSTFTMLKFSIIKSGVDLLGRAIASQLNEGISRLDTMKNFENVMSNLGIGSKDAQLSISRLGEALKGLPTTLDDAALSVQRFTAANGDVKASTEIFLAFNNAVLAGGAPLQLQATAIEQMSQAYSRGKFEMNEWYTLMQAMPAQLKQIANVMGYTGTDATAALYEGLKSGEVGMNEFMVTMVKMNKEGLNGFKSFEEQARNSTGGIETSMKNVGTAVARALADIMDAIGRSNIAGFFDMIRNAIDRVVPYIVAFIKLMKTAVSYVVGFFGVKLQDETKKTSKQFDNLGGSVGKTSNKMKEATGSAKKLKNEMKQLASFDEMNVLKDNQNSDSGGSNPGGGSLGGLGGIDLSPYDELNTKVSKSDEIFENMIEKIKQFGNLLSGLNFAPLIEHAKNIGNSIKGIFENPILQEAVKNWKNVVLSSLGSIVKSTAQIGLNIAHGLIGSIDRYLQQNGGRISEFIATMFDINAENFKIEAQVREMFARISEALTGPVAEQIGADIIAMFLNPAMSLQEIYEKLMLDLTKLFFMPFIENTEKIKTAFENTLSAVQPLFDTLAEAMTYIGDAFVKLYDEYLHPFFESLTVGLSDTFGKFLDVYNEYIAPFINYVATGFQDLWETHLKPFVKALVDLIGSIIDVMKLLWERYLKPLIDWLIQYMLPVIMPILSQIWNAVKFVASVIIDVVTHIINVLKGIIDFVVGVFTGDWDKAWGGIKTIFESIWNTIVKIISSAIDFVFETIKNGLQKAWNIVKAIVMGIYTSFKTIFDNIKNVIKTVMDAIGSIMKAGWDGVWKTIKGIINRIIDGIERMCNAIVNGLNKVMGPLADVGNKVLETIGIKGFKFSKIGTVKLPRLEKGGIINLPGKGVPVGGALGGERRQEGVLPLTDSQQMELLGEAIGRYITVNNVLNNYMNSRLISRELYKSDNESAFATNK